MNVWWSVLTILVQVSAFFVLYKLFNAALDVMSGIRDLAVEFHWSLDDEPQPAETPKPAVLGKPLTTSGGPCE